MPLLSLWDIMQRFQAVGFTAIFANLERAIAAMYIDGMMAAEKGQAVWEDSTEVVREAIAAVNTGIEKAPISKTIKGESARLLTYVSQTQLNNDVNRAVAMTLTNNFKFNVMSEMSTHLFLLVPSTHRELFEQELPLFGEEVADRFPDAIKDIKAAGKCMALDQWTAAVFHLMRVLEHGLRDLATRTGATFASGIELENWKNIIDVIEKEIRKQEQLPKSPQKTSDLEFYSKAASQCWHFKEAWRNHVSHSRASYDETDAEEVHLAVGRFMQQLAEHS